MNIDHDKQIFTSTSTLLEQTNIPDKQQTTEVKTITSEKLVYCISEKSSHYPVEI